LALNLRGLDAAGTPREVISGMHSDPDTQWQLRGPTCLDDAALLSFLLTRGGAPGHSTLDLAARVLDVGGGLGGLRHARQGELCEIPGIGPSRAKRLLALVELSRRLSEHPVPEGERCLAPDVVYRMVRGRLRDCRQESLWSLMLDQRGRRIELLEIARGGRNTVSVSPAEVFEPALRAGAAQLILIHNHPSGDPEPSPQDRQMTERLRAAGDLLGILVTDHVIIGRSSYSSLVERGLWHEGRTDWATRSGAVVCSASELQVSDAGETAKHTTRHPPARASAESAQRVGVALEDEHTPWVLPDQLPLPFLLQLRLPFASCDAPSATQADTDPRSWGELSVDE
jgi:DNA repair protein RadC